MSDARIGNVIFDIGGVVLSWSPDEILRKFYADESLRAGAKLHMFQHPDWVEMDRGTLHEADAIHRFQQRTGRPLTEVAGLLQAAKESLQPIPETLLLLQDLASKEIPLYCLSNMPATTAVYLRERQSTDSWFYGNMGE